MVDKDAEDTSQAAGPTGDDARAAQAAFAAVEETKSLGSKHFRDGNIDTALGCYTEALRLFDESGGGPDVPIRAILASNQALCLLKLGRPAEAEARASAALAADPASSKAIYRRGLARIELRDARGAYEDLQKATRLEPQNLEVRERCEEARKLAEASPDDALEVAVASGAAGALGMAGGGLYVEKPDLNEGRLAETHREQREWIKTISVWEEIKEIAFADEEAKACISVYMTLPGVHEITPNKVCVWMQTNSLEVRVIDLRGTNWMWMAHELWGHIDAEASSYKIRKNKISFKLQKRPSARSWDRWEKLRRI